MNASFSLRRFGVISRIRSARSLVWSGGSIVTMCSNMGSWSRCCVDERADVVAPLAAARGTAANGPTTELQDEKSSVLRYTSLASS